MVALVAALAGLVLAGVVSSQRLPVTTGKEGLLGQLVTVIEPLAPTGRVKLRGENWAARQAGPSLHPAETGQKARVTGVSGLTLLVEPLAVEPVALEPVSPQEAERLAPEERAS
jgi:membrane protein implicated in regulation of membrane protease activity